MCGLALMSLEGNWHALSDVAGVMAVGFGLGAHIPQG